jgi:hypothetical protein
MDKIFVKYTAMAISHDQMAHNARFTVNEKHMTGHPL